ncbi:MAG: hypothetical protein PVG14_21365 [Anaerolineales bacterium]
MVETKKTTRRRASPTRLTRWVKYDSQGEQSDREALTRFLLENELSEPKEYS